VAPATFFALRAWSEPAALGVVFGSEPSGVRPYRDAVTVTVAPTLTQTRTVMLTLTLAPTRLPPAAYPDSNPDTSPNPYLTTVTWLLAATRRASHRRGACWLHRGAARARAATLDIKRARLCPSTLSARPPSAQAVPAARPSAGGRRLASPNKFCKKIRPLIHVE
jgi:hypothetical protein